MPGAVNTKAPRVIRRLHDPNVVSAVNLPVLGQQVLKNPVQPNDFKLLISVKAGTWHATLDQLRLKLHHGLNLTLVEALRRGPTEPPASLLWLFVHQAIGKVFAVGISVSHFRDAQEVADARAAHVDPLAQLPEVRLEENFRLFVLRNLLVLTEEHLNFFVPFYKVSRHDLDNTEDGSLVKVVDEALCLLRHREVVASGEHVRNAVLVL